MSDYARRHALADHPEPFVIRAIPLEEARRLAGEPIKPADLPAAVVLLATGGRFEVHSTLFMNAQGVELAWRYSPAYRAMIRRDAPHLVADFIEVTGVE